MEPSVRDLGIRPSTAALALQWWLRPAERAVHETSASAVIHLRLLAVPALVLGNSAPLALERKDAALLALLVLDGPLPRARAAAMLRPDAEPQKARNSLRQRLLRLRRSAGAMSSSKTRRWRWPTASITTSRVCRRGWRVIRRRRPLASCSAPSATRIAKSSTTGYAARASGSVSCAATPSRPPPHTRKPADTSPVAQLSRFHSLPPPQSPGRLQADTSLGRLVLQDMPERNLVLDAYAAKK
jgi:hypothetical protein